MDPEIFSQLKQIETGNEILDAEALGQKNKPWVGVDLEGTLAFETGTHESIGSPVPQMLDQIRKWMKYDHFEVKIITPRAQTQQGQSEVYHWLKKHDLPPLSVTDQKDFFMIELWSTRAVQIASNTGRVIGFSPNQLDPLIGKGLGEVSKPINFT